MEDNDESLERPQQTRRRIRHSVVALASQDASESENDDIDDVCLDVITKKEKRLIRKLVWQPKGEYLREIGEIHMSFKTAWNVGMEGCTALKRSASWLYNLQPKVQRMRYLRLDGTNPTHFLSVIRSTNEVPTVKFVSLKEVKEGSFNGSTCSLTIQRDHQETHYEGLDPKFFDAILVCIREWETQDVERCLMVLRQLNQKAERLFEREEADVEREGQSRVVKRQLDPRRQRFDV